MDSFMDLMLALAMIAAIVLVVFCVIFIGMMLLGAGVCQR